MITPRRAILTLAIGVALFLFVLAFTLGPDDQGAVVSDPAVEFFVPPPGSQVLRQAEIGLDLEPGWTGVLLIDGVEIPEDQLRRVPAENQFFFSPGEGKDIEELEPGTRRATGLIWQSVGETREHARSVTWTFRVS